MMYPKLEELMAYNNMRHKDLAKVINRSQQSTSNKLNGKSDFKRPEMQRIKDYFAEWYSKLSEEIRLKIFPDQLITMDKIFERNIFLR